jgi:hypothetical protein
LPLALTAQTNNSMKRINYHTWIPLLLASFTLSCSSSDVDDPTGAIKEPPLFFRGGMDSVTIANNNGRLRFEGWNSLRAHEYIDGFNFNNLGGVAYAYQEIVDNPTKPGEKVMRAVVLDDDPNVPGTARAQVSIGFNDGVDLPTYHTSLRMFFHKDVEQLTLYPGNISWFIIFEAWAERVATWDGNVAGSARWNLSLAKDKTGTNLYWMAQAETMQPASVEQDIIWVNENRSVPVPYNSWFTLDVQITRGAGDKGRMVIKMTPDGESTKVLFDIKNTTMYPDHPEILLAAWQPFKFYFSDTYLDWMKANNKVLSCYYNDFKWYKE